MRSSPKFFIAFALISAFLCCAPGKKAKVTPQQLVEYNRKILQAEDLVRKGSYSCLKQAFQIYQDLLGFPDFQRKIRMNLAKTALLLCLRENELSIVEEVHYNKAKELIQKFPYLSELSPYLEFVQATDSITTGIVRRSLREGAEFVDYFDWIRENAVQLNTRLKEKAETEDFFASLYIAFNSEFPHYIKEKDDFSRFLAIFPDSPLIHYQLALFPKFNPERLEALVRSEPHFYEARYYLGEWALRVGKILTAEGEIFEAYEHIPQSLSIIMALTKIYFALEETDKCLEYNEKALDLVPDYRDALLGKAISLSYLGRNEEVIAVLGRLLEMGMYLMGETHYWLAWNKNELRQYSEAWEFIEKTKNFLIGHPEVYSLAGVIAFAMGNLDESEKNLKEALRLNALDCEAGFYLGKIFATREDWESSGMDFEKAAVCYEGTEKALLNRIKEIEDSTFTEERKQKHISRKKIQLKKILLIKATAFYNAAAGYFNAGMKEKALHLAQKAALHESFKEKAEALIATIKIDL